MTRSSRQSVGSPLLVAKYSDPHPPRVAQGYTEVLTGRCLGERWRMVVPPHLAYGDQGVGEDIPGGATLTFDVRLVQHNSMRWSEEVRGRKVLGISIIIIRIIRIIIIIIIILISCIIVIIVIINISIIISISIINIVIIIIILLIIIIIIVVIRCWAGGTSTGPPSARRSPRRTPSTCTTRPPGK